MAKNSSFDPTDLLLSSMGDIFDGLANSLRGSGGPSYSRQPSGQSSDKRDEDPPDWRDDDDDQNQFEFQASTGNDASAATAGRRGQQVNESTSSATFSEKIEDIPEPIRPVVEEIKNAVNGVPGIQPEDVIQFCSNKKNWPLLKLLLKIGVAAIGLATIVALIGAAVAAAEETQKERNKKEPQDPLVKPLHS